MRAAEVRAAVITEPRGPVSVREVALREPGTGEGLVRMEACGLCHSGVFVAGLEKLPLLPLALVVDVLVPYFFHRDVLSQLDPQQRWDEVTVVLLGILFAIAILRLGSAGHMEVLARVATGLKKAMVGMEIKDIAEENLIQHRGW